MTAREAILRGRDPIALFAHRASAAGAEVVEVTTQTWPADLLGSLRRRGVRTVALWDDPLLEPLRAALATDGVRVLTAAQQEASRLAEADAGVTTADWAVAETGSLVLACSPGRPRGTSLLPPLHVAVLPAGRIVSTLAELLARAAPVPSALTLVCGPSRTADIELTPVRGVHGPTAVWVYLLR